MERIDNRLLKEVDQLPYTPTQTPQIDQHINQELAGTMIGYLATPVYSDHRDRAWIEEMLLLAAQAQGKYRGMLQAPDLILGHAGTCIGESAHGFPRRRIINQTELANDNIHCCWACPERNQSLFTQLQ